MKDNEYYMNIAIREARISLADSNPPVGAVLVKSKKVIGKGRNITFLKNNDLKHAEIVALFDSIERYGQEATKGATLFTTLAPCPMCLWASVIMGVKKIVIGCNHDSREDSESFGSYTVNKLLEMMDKKIQIELDILESECADLWNNWLHKDRINK